MKKMLFVSMALLAMVAFAGGVSAAEKTGKILGKVADYKAGEMLKLFGGFEDSIDYSGDVPRVKESPHKDWVFKINSSTKVKGEIGQGTKVRVRYTGKPGGEMTAVSIEKIR